MKKVLIKSKRFFIRNLKISDVNINYLNWFKDKQIKNFIEFSPGNNMDFLKENVLKQISKKNVIFLGIFDSKKRHLGNIKFDNIFIKRSCCNLGIMIGNKKWRGRGVASEVITECANYLYKQYGIRKIYLGVKLKNRLAISSYKNLGFVTIKKKNSKSIIMCRDYFKSKISIGTAQLGLSYGIANQLGKMNKNEMKKIIKLSIIKGINTIETAEAYSSAEKDLGTIGINKFKIITKLPPSYPQKKISSWVNQSIKNSIKKLKIHKLEGLLVHNSKQLSGRSGNQIYKSLLKAKRQKLINKIGVSIYSMNELRSLFSKYKFDIVSAPFNIVDQRLKKSGWLYKLKKAKIDVYARSIFLQGLLLMNKNQRPKIFNKWNKFFKKWDKIVHESGKSRLEICLGFVLKNPDIDKIVLGFDSYKQFAGLVKKIKPLKISSSSLLSNKDKKLINPSNWSLL